MAFNITNEKLEQLEARLAKLGVLDADLEENFIKGAGSGGQKVNATSSCVQLIHKPSGIEVKCQRERSQAMNRFFARRELCERLEEKAAGEKSKKQQEAEKIRRQKRRRSRRAKKRVLADKHHQAEKKERRKPVKPDD